MGPQDEAGEDSAWARGAQELLFLAARSGDFKAVVSSVSKGADINAKTLRGQSPLMLAAGISGDGGLETIKFLVTAKAQVEEKDCHGWNALHHACRNAQQSTVIYLIDSNASLKARSADGFTPVMLATVDCSDELVLDLFSRKSEIDKRDDNGWPVLFHSVANGRHQLVKWLIGKGASVKEKSKDGTTALMVAAEQGYPKIGHFLIKKGSGVNVINEYGNTALIVSMQHRMEEFALMILNEHDCDVTVCNNEGDDALMISGEFSLGSIKAKIEAKLRRAAETEEAGD